MNLTFLSHLISLFLPYYFFDSKEKYFPIEMIDMLSDQNRYGSLYYGQTFLSDEITSYDELLQYMIVDDDRPISSNLSYTNNQTLFTIHGNEQFIFEGIQNTEHPIYVESITWENSIYLIYTNLYMFNGEIHCGYVIPCGFHEGDIEHLIVQLDAHSYEPHQIFLSSHRNGYWFPWKSIRTYGTHPLVYVASMTHAMYPTNGYFLRCFGLLSDHTDGKIFWKPKKIILLHVDFHRHAKEYMFNGYIGSIASFPNKKTKYIRQLQESHLPPSNVFSMLGDMFFTME